MFLQLAHTKLDVFQSSKAFVLCAYAFVKAFPAEERYSLTSQIRRAALSVHLNIAEGSSRKSDPERRRFYEIARGSLIEVDTALDIAAALHYGDADALKELGETIIKTFKILSGLIKRCEPTHN
ncbi:MAG: ribosomal protein [Flaviaesturariibacter sp.]|nr:ribosomal protein [Flaviaesturariibacter sp.]